MRRVRRRDGRVAPTCSLHSEVEQAPVHDLSAFSHEDLETVRRIAQRAVLNMGPGSQR